MTDVTTEWAGRSEFHEVAEALGVDTDRIMAVRRGTVADAPAVMALYTPDYDQGDETIWMALLRRDPDGVLGVVKREPQPGLWERIKGQVDESMRKRLGDP